MLCDPNEKEASEAKKQKLQAEDALWVRLRSVTDDGNAM
jgi:hypothetical protein